MIIRTCPKCHRRLDQFLESGGTLRIRKAICGNCGVRWRVHLNKDERESSLTGFAFVSHRDGMNLKNPEGGFSVLTPWERELLKKMEANFKLVKALIARPTDNSLYQPAIYACARRCAHFAFELQPELRECPA